MILKTQQKAGQNGKSKVSRAFSKVNTAYQKVNLAYSQFCDSKILLSLDSGKLYFEFLKIFSVPENTCPCRGQKRLRSRRFYSIPNVNF
jgi:hypothetical protein